MTSVGMLLLISVNTEYRKRPYNIILNKGKVKSYRNISNIRFRYS